MSHSPADELTAWLKEQGIPLDVMKRTLKQRRQATAKQMELGDRAFDEHPEWEFGSMGNDGRVTGLTCHDIDADIEFDRVQHNRAPRRQSIGVRRRTCAGGRRRRGARRVVRSSSSASSDSEGESDPPGYRHALAPFLLVGRSTRLLSASMSRIGTDFARLHEATPGLTGAERLQAFGNLPQAQQEAAWADLRWAVEARRELVSA